MKYLVCGDVHWCQYSSILRARGIKYSVRLENLIKSVNWVEELATKKGCIGIIYLGDFFDRPDLNAEELTALQEIKWASIKHIFIVGNHESNVLNLSFSSTKLFESIEATVINKPTYYDINDKISFNFIPYILPSELKPLSEYVLSDKKNVVFAHEDIAGIQYGKITSIQGFNIKDIENNCTLFIDGHLHNGGMIGKNIILAGNLTGQNFNENAQIYSHNVYTIDIDDDNITINTYENKEAFKFYKIKIENDYDVKQIENLPKNSIVSISCNNLYKDIVLKTIGNNDNIIDSRMSIYYINNMGSEEEREDFEVKDHFEQFILFAKSKLSPSPILDDELSKLKGN